MIGKVLTGFAELEVEPNELDRLLVSFQFAASDPNPQYCEAHAG